MTKRFTNFKTKDSLSLKYYSIYLNQAFSVRNNIVNTVGSLGHIASVTTTQLGCFNKQSIFKRMDFAVLLSGNNKEMKKRKQLILGMRIICKTLISQRIT